MSRALTDGVWILLAACVIVALVVAFVAGRRFLLERGGGTVECGLRRPAGSGSWRLGVASYQRDELHWYGALGVLPRPGMSLSRRSLEIVSRREPQPSEARVLGPERVVIELTADPAERVEIALTEQALTGFLAWLEASPPGSHLQDIA